LQRNAIHILVQPFLLTRPYHEAETKDASMWTPAKARECASERVRTPSITNQSSTTTSEWVVVNDIAFSASLEGANK
jgi:hypothetical protein